MRKHIVELIKGASRKMGVEISRYPPRNHHSIALQHVLSVTEVDLVLDIGANVGQYARSIREVGYTGRIVSFEPLSTAHAHLTLASQADPGWIVAPRMAIGDTDGEIEINIAGNSYSSSILAMLETHMAAAPDSAYIGIERVRLARLDSVAVEYCGDVHSIFLKVDTQGYESQVLAGGAMLLQRVTCMQLELSLVPLYAGQVLFVEMVDLLSDLGYELFSVIPGFSDEKTGRLLQVDGIFLRRNV